jgi:hypothetical protein
MVVHDLLNASAVENALDTATSSANNLAASSETVKRGTWRSDNHLHSWKEQLRTRQEILIQIHFTCIYPSGGGDNAPHVL